MSLLTILHRINAQRRRHWANAGLSSCVATTFLITVLWAWLIAAKGALAQDTPQGYDSHSPPWLQAVGQLYVPGSRYENGRRKHYREDCSATLIKRAGQATANTVITAWHCLEYYHDLSQAIQLTLRPGSPHALTRQAYRVADGGSMRADWALLKLYKTVSGSEAPALTLLPKRVNPLLPVTMAGYSRQPGLAAGATGLSYDDACRVTTQGRLASESNCYARKGASGGAVIQLSTHGVPQFAGVISRGDSENLSIYIPVDHFRGAITRHLK